MKIGVLKENKQNEKRVALTPSIVKKIKTLAMMYLLNEMQETFQIFIIQLMKRQVLK